jgi:hypothetical protein
MPRTQMVAGRIEWVAVIFQVAADVDWVLTHLTIEGLALTSPSVHDLDTIT